VETKNLDLGLRDSIKGSTYWLSESHGSGRGSRGNPPDTPQKSFLGHPRDVALPRGLFGGPWESPVTRRLWQIADGRVRMVPLAGSVPGCRPVPREALAPREVLIHKQGPPDAYSGGPLLMSGGGRDRCLDSTVGAPADFSKERHTGRRMGTSPNRSLSAGHELSACATRVRAPGEGYLMCVTEIAL
jgi:hypothetical protein